MDKKTLIKTAYLHFRDGRWHEAIQEYQKLLQMDPTDILALNMLGDAFARQGKITEALQYYRMTIEIFNKQGARDKVEILQRKMSKLDPNSVSEPDGQTERPETAPETLDLGSFREPIEQLKGKISSDPKNPDLFQKLADLLEKAGQKAEAAEQLSNAANLFYNNKQAKKAQELFEAVVKLDPGNLQAHIVLGEIFSKENADSEAKKEFLFVAEQLIRQGNLERGQLFAQKAIALKSIEAHYYLGLVFLQKNQLAEARTEFETLLKFKVSHQGALTHLAGILMNQNQVDEAQAMYERLSKADPKNADAVEKLAEIAMHKGETALACERFDQATNLFAQQEQWERATLAISQAIKLEPRQAERYLKLADAAYNAGLEQQAAEACQTLAEIYDSQGKREQAEQVRAKARELLESPGEAAPAAAPAAPPKPSPKTAPEPPRTRERKLSPAEEAQVMLNIASNYIRQGAIDEAIEIYQKILKGDPSNEEVKKALTRAYAMFAGVNPETAVSKKSGQAPASPGAARPGPTAQELDEQRVQREARERAQREAQVRSQRSPAEPAAPTKTPGMEAETFRPDGHSREDEVAGDQADEFMTVTVAEI